MSKAERQAKRQQRKEARQSKKQQKQIAKQSKKQQKQVAKQSKKQQKQNRGGVDVNNIAEKYSNAVEVAQTVAPGLYEKGENYIKNKFNINTDEMSDTVTSEENSSGEVATASAKEGFFAKHKKAIFIGAGAILLIGGVMAVIFSKKKSAAQVVSGLLSGIGDNDEPPEELGYIEPIDLS